MEEKGFVSKVYITLSYILYCHYKLISQISFGILKGNLHLFTTTFSLLVEGYGTVHLTGNLLNDGRDMLDDMDVGDESMEAMEEKKEENGNVKHKMKSEVNGKAGKKTDLKHKNSEDKNEKLKKKNID